MYFLDSRLYSSFRLQGYQTETNATQSSILPSLLCTAPDSKLVTISFLNCNQEMHSRDSSVTEERHDKPVEEWESKEDKTWMHLITSCCYLSAKTSDYFRIVFFFFLKEEYIFLNTCIYMNHLLKEIGITLEICPVPVTQAAQLHPTGCKRLMEWGGVRKPGWQHETLNQFQGVPVSPSGNKNPNACFDILLLCSLCFTFNYFQSMLLQPPASKPQQQCTPHCP